MTRMFGTNGVRGVVGKDMTVAVAAGLGRAIGSVLGGPILVCRDARLSGPMLSQALMAGLAEAGVEPVDGGLAPTPALQMSVRDRGYAGGAMITASHNPPEFNGIKVVARDGTETQRDVEDRIETAYHEDEGRARWDRVPSPGTDPEVVPHYVDRIVDPLLAPELDGFGPVLLDCGNGAGALTGPAVLSRLGVRFTTMNAQPDGRFPGHPSEPTPENIRDLLANVPALDAKLGAVLDGDADRCIFVTARGEYVPGERTLALAGAALVRARGGGVVVTGVSSSRCVEDAVRAAGGRVDYTAVGSPIIARRMMDLGEEAVFGGEENGGLIFPRHQYCRDGTMALAWLVHHVATTGADLGKLLEAIPQHHMIKQRVAIPAAARDSFLETLQRRFPDADHTDGVRIERDGGWVLIRPSGTEPLVRVFAEAPALATAEKLSQWGLKEVRALTGA